MGDFSADILQFPAQATSPAPQPTGGDTGLAAPDTGFGADIAAMGHATSQDAKGAVIGAQDANPDAAGRASQLAPKVGAPPGLVESQLSEYEKQHQITTAAGIMDQHPSIAGWVANDPHNARVAKDDFEHLGTLSKLTTAITSGWTAAELGNQRGRLGAEAMAGADVGGQVADLDKRLGDNPAVTGVYGYLQKASGFAGGLLDNFFHGVTQGGALGAVAGAGAGSAAAGIGAVPGAITGGLVGTGVGFKYDMARVAAGNTYLSLNDIRGHDGQPINPVVKDAASVLVGLGTYALAGIGTNDVAKPAADAVGKFLGDSMAEAVTRPTIAKALTNFSLSLGKAGLTGAALNSAMEGTSIFGEEFAKQLSGGQNFDTLFNDPLQRQQAVDHLITAAVDGATLFPLVHLPIAAGSLVGDTLRARNSATDTAAFQALETGAVDSKTRARSVDAFQSFMRSQTDGTPVENIGVTGEAIRTLYQSAGVEPGPGDGLLGDIVPDLKSQMSQATETGGDIIVPTAAYVAHLAGTPVSEALRADIRFRPDGMTMNEAREYETKRGELLADLATQGRASADAEAARDNPIQQIQDEVRSQLRSAGQGADLAEQVSRLVSERYAARGERLGRDPLELYKAEGISIRRDVPETLRHVPTDESDLVINALRNDNRKVPKERDLFGPSMHEAVKAMGGIVDTGGELRAMDLHKTKGLIRKASEDKQENIDHGADNVARAMWDAGYFPELTERPTPDQLFDAMRRGDERYSQGAGDERKAAFEEAVKDLDEFVGRQGIDVKTATNAEIKAALQKHIDEEMAREGRGFEQGERGRLDLNDGRSIITLFKDADASTALHEFGHQWLEEMFRDAALPDAPEGIKADVAAIRKWLGVKDGQEGDAGALSQGPKDTSGLTLSEFGPFKTGEPVTFDYLHNTDSATKIFGKPKKGDQYARDLEPSGRYMVADEAGGTKANGTLTTGTVTFKNPLVLDTKNWKQELSAKYGKTGKRLSDALIRDGYDGVVTVSNSEIPGRSHTSEILDLTTFDRSKALYQDERGQIQTDRGANLTTEQHEQFARGFEAYLMEGRAPSSALASAFRKFKSWLTRIYKTVAALRVPINDEIRGVFDRMVASDEAIESWRNTENLRPVFATAKDGGMTDAEFTAYSKGIERSRTQADEKMLAKTMAAIRKQRTAEWKAEAATVRDEVSGEVKSRPDLKAQYFLRTGKMLDDPEAPAVADKVRLSRDDLDAMYGTDEAAKALPSGIIQAEGGAHPDEVAELFGYRSGGDMVRALMTLEAAKKQAEEQTGKPMDGQKYVNHLIESRTQEIMLDRHGDALNDGSIESDALDAVHNSAQADVMAMETRAIAKRAGVTALKLDDIKAWADGQIAGMNVKRGTDMRSFARLEAKFGREAERALLKGKFEEAFQAKQKQLINHVLATKAAAAAEDYEAAQKMFSRYANKQTMPTVDQSYMDRIHSILKRIGYATKRGDEELAGGLGDASLEKWADQQAESLDYPYIPDFLKDGTWSKASVDDMTTGEMFDLKDTITSLSKMGRDLKTMEVDGKRIETAELIDEARETAKALPSVEPRKSLTLKNASTMEWLGAKMAQANANLVAEETIFNLLDGGKTSGVFTRVVFRPLKEALFGRDKRLAEMTTRLGELKSKMPKGWSGHLLDKISTPELIDRRTGKAWSITRGEMLGIMLNMGNEGNLSKMLKGEGWDADAVHAVVNRYANKEDWDFVQHIWDMHESLLPDIDALTRRDTGVGLDKVKAVPVETPHGTYAGGYYPMEYDRTRAYDVEKRQQRAEGLSGDNYHRAGTTTGHTKGRVDNYSAPLDFSLDLIPFRLGQHIHDLYMREAVKQADRFLGHDKIRSLVEDKFGREYYKTMRPWLQSIAQDRNINDVAQSWVTHFLNGARANATVLGIGFRVSTMLRHGMTALTNSFGVVGPTHMLKAIQHVYGNPTLMRARIEHAMANSIELPHRFDSLDRDTREALERNLGNTVGGGIDKIAGGHVAAGLGSVASGVRAGAIRYSHYGIATLDMASAIPTWYAGRNKFMLENPDALLADAHYAADKAVRDAHGAQSIVDLPEIQRGHPLQKLVTMFYGFMNRMYNRTYEGVRAGRAGVADIKAGQYGDARRDFAMMLNRLSYSVIIPAFADAMVAGFMGKEVEEEGETFWDWMLKALAGGAASQVPILRDIANRELHPGTEYTMSPVQRAIETPLKSLDDLETIFRDDKEPSRKWVQHAIETPGYVFGLPTGQPASGAQYLWDLNSGNVDPGTASDVMKGLLFGAPKKGK